MLKPFFGAIIGFVIGLLIGWIINTFVMDQAAIEEFARITKSNVILVVGIIGLVAGLIICYIFKEDKI